MESQWTEVFRIVSKLTGGFCRGCNVLGIPCYDLERGGDAVKMKKQRFWG